MLRTSKAGIWMALALLPMAATSEPVHVAQGDSIGKGYTIRRGNDCYVLTALHVLGEPGEPIKVSDRSAAQASAKSIFSDKSADFALLQIDGKSVVACADEWTAPGWLANKRFKPSDEFSVISSDKTGRETIYTYKYAGGTAQDLTLAPTDKSRAVQSDSGSPVFFGDYYAGVLQSVDTATDRITVFRADMVDVRLAQVLRGAGVAERVIAVGEVTHNGRAVEDWSIYTRESLAGAGVGSVVTGNASNANCKMSAKVIGVQAARQPNPKYLQAQEYIKSNCMKDRGGFAKIMCETNKNTLKTAPPNLAVWQVDVDVELESPDAGGFTKLGNFKYNGDPSLAPNIAQRQVVAQAVTATVKDMIAGGACN
jgi:hypothetical protein